MNVTDSLNPRNFEPSICMVRTAGATEAVATPSLKTVRALPPSQTEGWHWLSKHIMQTYPSVLVPQYPADLAALLGSEHRGWQSQQAGPPGE